MKTKKTLTELPENWQDFILDSYRDGGSDNDAKALFVNWLGSMSNHLWFRWLEEEPEFAEVINTGRILSQSWWEEHAKQNLYNKDFNAPLWYMNMKNRFGWSDTQKIDHTSGGEKISISLVRG